MSSPWNVHVFLTYGMGWGNLNVELQIIAQRNVGIGNYVSITKNSALAYWSWSINVSYSYILFIWTRIKSNWCQLHIIRIITE